MHADQCIFCINGFEVINKITKKDKEFCIYLKKTLWDEIN